MTDAELRAFLNLTEAEALVIIPRLTPAKRATYERMADVIVEEKLWRAGLGPKPNALLDYPRRRGRFRNF
jgi:hypothetical protein